MLPLLISPLNCHNVCLPVCYFNFSPLGVLKCDEVLLLLVFPLNCHNVCLPVCFFNFSPLGVFKCDVMLLLLISPLNCHDTCFLVLAKVDCHHSLCHSHSPQTVKSWSLTRGKIGWNLIPFLPERKPICIKDHCRYKLEVTLASF